MSAVAVINPAQTVAYSGFPDPSPQIVVYPGRQRGESSVHAGLLSWPDQALYNNASTFHESRAMECAFPKMQWGPDSVSRIERALAWLLQNTVVIPDVTAVREYLTAFPDMASILLSVCTAATQQFKSNGQLSLELYRDPEVEDDYLTLYIRQSDYDDHVLDDIEQINKSLEEELAGTSGWLLATTDFRPPR